MGRIDRQSLSMLNKYMESYEYCKRKEINKEELQKNPYFPAISKRPSVSKFLDGITPISDLTPVQREQLRQDLQVYEKHAKEMQPGRSKTSQSFDTLAKPRTYLEATKQSMDHAFAMVRHADSERIALLASLAIGDEAIEKVELPQLNSELVIENMKADRLIKAIRLEESSDHCKRQTKRFLQQHRLWRAAVAQDAALRFVGPPGTESDVFLGFLTEELQAFIREGYKAPDASTSSALDSVSFAENSYGIFKLEGEEQVDGTWFAVCRSGLLTSTTKELGNANLRYRQARDAFQHVREREPHRLFDAWYDAWRAQTRLQQAVTNFRRAEKIQKLLDVDGVKTLPRWSGL